MKKLSKHIIFAYIAASIVGIGFIINLLILPASNNLYRYVPVDSEVVIEINAINFMKEAGEQWVYQPQHFTSQSEVEDEIISESVRDLGVNVFSKIILFNELWAEESLWFAVMECTNRKKLENYVSSNLPKSKLTIDKKIAIIQLSSSLNQEEVDRHIATIFDKKIKSIEANPVVKKEFSSSHEINVYLKSLKSDYVTDGYLNINFHASQIDISGYFHPIGSTDIKPIAYKTEQDIGLSLRSSLNLLSTIYLLNGTKLDYLPDYKQLALDYDGVNMITNNDVIPVTSYPNINLMLDINDEKVWLQYLDASIDDGSLIVAGDTIMINSEVKAKVKYQIAEQKFKLFQTPKEFTLAEEGLNTYFDLVIHPKEFLDKMYFKEDQKNPPKLVATQIIKIVKSILDDFSYITAVDEINFTITKDSLSDDYISTGHLIFRNTESHSTIESYFLFRNFMTTVGNLLH